MNHLGVARAFALLGAALLASACSETSLNEAPVVDLSARAGPPLATLRPGGAAAPVVAEVFYTVQKGDTLFRIATAFHCTASDLAHWNEIEEGAPIFVGQRLRVRAPAAGGPVAAAPGGAPASAAAPGNGAPGAQSAPAETEASAVAIPLGTTVETRSLEAVPLAAPEPMTAASPGGGAAASAAAGAAPAVAALGAGPAAATAPAAPPGAGAAEPVLPGASAAPAPAWLWPVEGRVRAKFDAAHSKGIDIGVLEDAPVVAVADGEVSYTGKLRDYGNLVIVAHADGLRSVYAHAKSIEVKQGQAVARGQQIATAGKSGSGEPRLHFEVRRKGVPVDPMEFLPAR